MLHAGPSKLFCQEIQHSESDVHEEVSVLLDQYDKFRVRLSFLCDAFCSPPLETCAALIGALMLSATTSSNCLLY